VSITVVVTLTSNKKFTISNGKKTKSYKAGKYVTIKKNYALLKGGKSLTIEAKNNGKIKITSINRAQGTPSYRGSMVVQYVSGKGLTLVNHVAIRPQPGSLVDRREACRSRIRLRDQMGTQGAAGIAGESAARLLAARPQGDRLRIGSCRCGERKQITIPGA